MTPRLQKWIHLLEVGEGSTYVRNAVAVLALLALTAAYDWLEFRNMARPEAMDAAQLARNIARGEGFTTKFIRPLSIHLVETRQGRLAQHTNDLALLRTAHPDLANPPVYPVLLAAAMRVLPFDYDIPEGRIFLRYQPDLLISLFNQGLFLLLILLVFQLAKKLFDAAVAWVSAIVLAGTELLWRFTVSGLPTVLLMILFVTLVWCLASMEGAAREGKRGKAWLTGMALLAGAMVGICALTRYALGWLIVPVVAFLALYFPTRRLALPLAATLAFLALMSPWVARNYRISGTPFGTAGFAVVEDNVRFPMDTLERSLEPRLEEIGAKSYLRKLLLNAGTVLQEDLPRLGGSWVSAFFLVGLMIRFVSPTLGRLRVFLLLSLLVLILAQALGHTHLSADASPVNSENLLVVIAPLVFVYGVAMFQLLLDQVHWAIHGARYLATGLFVLATSTPLLIALLPPRADPRVHPPYFPPLIQQVAGWLEEGELMMSDMPWAVAWYGNRPCVWTTLKVKARDGQEDFFAINDLRKTIHSVYLTPLTMDGRFFSEMYQDRDPTWGRLVVDGLLKTNLPPGFPLRSAHGGYVQRGHFLLMDRPRWKKP